MDNPINLIGTNDNKRSIINYEFQISTIKKNLENNAKLNLALSKIIKAENDKYLKLSFSEKDKEMILNNHTEVSEVSIDELSSQTEAPALEIEELNKLTAAESEALSNELDAQTATPSTQIEELNKHLSPVNIDQDANFMIQKCYDALITDYKNQQINSKSQTNSNSKINPDDLVFIDKAFKLANKLHSGMTRKSGEPYIIHPIRVARIAVTEIGLDTTSVVCALMHDTIEDTEITYEEIKKELGDEVAKIVEGLTKIRAVFKGKDYSIAKEKAENVRKIILTLGEDVRVILIKLADRLDNMRTMDAMPTNKQETIASETLYLYVPIAHRLGLYTIKSELEDLCLKYTQREAYKEIALKLQQTKRSREAYIKNFIEPIKQLLEDNDVPPDTYRIFGRPKHIYSIWNKIKKKEVSFEQIHDLFAIRIVLKTPETLAKERDLCFKVYATVTNHQNGGYTPNADRMRDWISHPKGNGYESLHTTVLARDGRPVEIQIRTERMDIVAERGVAAHWLYKDKNDKDKKGNKNEKNVLTGFDKWLIDVREQLNEYRSAANAIDVLKDIKLELYEHEILVFTPKGEVITLKENATVLDFAFAIHTGLGCKCMGGEINGKLYPISHKLKNGDQVKIISGKKVKPNQEWLNFATTSKARNKIKSYINTERNSAKGELSEDGRGMLERKLRPMKVKVNIDVINQLTKHFKYPDSLDFLYSIATKEFDLSRLKEIPIIGDHFDFSQPTVKAVSLNNETPKNHYETDADIFDAEDTISIFSGFADKIDYSIAKCCQPKAGDNVYGFITIGQGIRIHRADCPNAADQKKRFPYRVIALKWAKQTEDLMYLIKLKIIGFDDVGILNKISNVISFELKMNMRSLSFDSNDGLFEGYIEVYVKNEKEVKNLIKRIKGIEGVHSVNKN